MTPVLTLGLLGLYGSTPLTLGDLTRASDVAHASVSKCQELAVSCTSPSGRVELARAIAVLYAEGRVLDGVADPVLAADVHRLAPDLAASWVGAKPPLGAEPWVESLLAMQPSK